MQEEVLPNGPKGMKPSLIGKSDKFPSGMCCPLIFCGNETMRGPEGPNKVPRSKKREWHDKRMKKKERDIGDKMLMNNSRCEVSQARKVSS